jgi:hypothetical protein
MSEPTWIAIEIEAREGGSEDTSTTRDTDAVAASAVTPPEGTSGRDRPNTELSFDSTLYRHRKDHHQDISVIDGCGERVRRQGVEAGHVQLRVQAFISNTTKSSPTPVQQEHVVS